jgi:acetyl esterase/lipase
MIKIIAPLILVVLFSACSVSDSSTEPTISEVPSFFGITPSDSPLESDILYFKDVTYGKKERNKLDLLLPNRGALNGMVILFHGGSFQFGNKEDLYGEGFNSILNGILENNIGIANANYSFITEIDSKGIFSSLNDGSEVISFIRKNQTVLEIPSDKLVLAGVSAGAGIAMWNGFRESENDQVEGIVALYAQSSYDLYEWQNYFTEFDLDSIRSQDSEIQDLFVKFYGGEYTLQKAAELNFSDQMDADDPKLYVYNPVYEDEVINGDTLNLDVLFHSFKHADFLRSKAVKVGLEFSGVYQELPDAFIKRVLID